MSKKSIGDLGESFAFELYEKSGYNIVTTNYHSRYGEIDLIAESEDILCFVEVKTRKVNTMSTPAEAVDYRKQRKLVLTAMKYLSDTQCYKQPRFDVLELWQQDGKIVRHNLIANAFSAEDFGGQYEIF